MNNSIDISTNIGLLRDFQINTKTEDLEIYSVDYFHRLTNVLLCNENNQDEFAAIFPDQEIENYRDHRMPLHGGRSKSYWEGQKSWNRESILRRQRRYIKTKLLPSTRRKAIEMLNGRNYQQQVAERLSADERKALSEMLSFLESDQSKRQKEQTENQE